MIFHLLYISEKTSLYHDSDLQTIIENSQLRNSAKEVTGILIKNGPFFIQLLEGKEETVMSVYRMISLDKRHDKCRVLMSFRDTKRMFPSWHMGLVEAKDNDIRLAEFIPYLHGGILTTIGTRDKMIQVLKNFNS